MTSNTLLLYQQCQRKQSHNQLTSSSACGTSSTAAQHAVLPRPHDTSLAVRRSHAARGPCDAHPPCASPCVTFGACQQSVLASADTRANSPHAYSPACRQPRVPTAPRAEPTQPGVPSRHSPACQQAGVPTAPACQQPRVPAAPRACSPACLQPRVPTAQRVNSPACQQPGVPTARVPTISIKKTAPVPVASAISQCQQPTAQCQQPSANSQCADNQCMPTAEC